MLTTNNKVRFQFLRKALVLPVTFAAIFAFSVSATESKATAAQLPEKVVAKNDTTPALTKEIKPEIPTLTADTIHIRSANKAAANEKKKVPGNVLYILNGNRVSAEEMSQIPPGNIRSINVLKDKSATDKYGSAGANGVIEIFLKELTLK